MPFPSDISELYLRLSAPSLGVGDGNPVSSWDNEQGAYLTFEQSTPAKQPIFISDAFNGNPAVRFDGSSWLGTSDNAALSGTPYTVVVVMVPTATGRLSVLRSGLFTSHSPDLDFYLDVDANSVRPVVVHNSPDARSFAFGKEHQPFDSIDPHVFAYTVSSAKESDFRLYFDGELLEIKEGLGSDNMLLEANGPLSLGMNFDESGGLSADVFEVLVYEKALTNADIVKLWNHYKTDYGIESLGPKKVRNLYAWFEAEDLTVGEGEAVPTWNDRLSAMSLTEADVEKQPSYSTSNPKSTPAVRFLRGTSLATASASAFENDEFATFLLYRTLDDQTQEFFKVGTDDLVFKSNPTHSLERLEVSSNNATQIQADDSLAVTDSLHTVGISLRGENEESTAFFVGGSKVDTGAFTQFNNTLPDEATDFVLGGNMEADVVSMIVVKGRVRDEDVSHIESYWKGKYLGTKGGNALLQGIATFSVADMMASSSATQATLTASPSLTREGTASFAGLGTFDAQSPTLGHALVSANATSNIAPTLEGSGTASLVGTSSATSVGTLEGGGEVAGKSGFAQLSGAASLDATTDEGSATVNTLHTREAGLV